MKIRSLMAATAACAFACSAFAADAPDKAKPAPPAHPNGPEAAAADVAKMTVPEGLQSTLFASEPMVVNPADMDVDERGRVWITEGANYRLAMHKDWGLIRPGGDRIVILEDSNRDGKADLQTVFYQDMTVNTALGICVLGNKAIVSASPFVFVLTDTDGDSKADRRELLFEDSCVRDHDHSTHAFVFGPDGKLYFNFGNEVKELRRRNVRAGGDAVDLPLPGAQHGRAGGKLQRQPLHRVAPGVADRQRFQHADAILRHGKVYPRRDLRLHRQPDRRRVD